LTSVVAFRDNPSHRRADANGRSPESAENPAQRSDGTHVALAYANHARRGRATVTNHRLGWRLEALSLLMASALMACGAADNQDVDDDDEVEVLDENTSAREDAVGQLDSLDGCALETFAPNVAHVVDTGTFLQAFVHLWCPTKRTAIIEAALREDVHFADQTVGPKRTSKIKRALERWFLVRVPCKADGGDGGKYYSVAVANRPLSYPEYAESSHVKRNCPY